MRRTIIALGCLCLAGCGATMNPRPPMMQIDLESTPPGANAVTSLGPACTTPCFVTLPIPSGDFTVNYTLADFQPMTVPVHVAGSPAGFMSPGTTDINPNPVVAQLQPVAPPPKPVRVAKKKLKKPTAVQ
jgi:hypothetical protein